MSCWGSPTQRKSHCAPTDLHCQLSQIVKAQEHFVLKRSCSPSFSWAMLATLGTSFCPPEATLGTDLFLLAGKNSSTSPVSSSAHSIPQPRWQLKTTDSFLYALFHLKRQWTSRQATVNCRLSIYLVLDYGAHIDRFGPSQKISFKAAHVTWQYMLCRKQTT